MRSAYPLQREVGQARSDRRRELEPVTGAGRADDDAAAALEDERLVGRRGVDARLGADWVGVGEPVGVARPGRDPVDEVRIGLTRAVRVGLDTGVVRADLEPV